MENEIENLTVYSLVDWMSENKTCPTCRMEIKREPVPNIIVDNLVERALVNFKDDDERKEYKEREQEYKKWIEEEKKKKKKKEEEEKKRRAAMNRNNNNNNRNNQIYAMLQNNNNRRHGLYQFVLLYICCFL